jgi:hypothetical protein
MSRKTKLPPDPEARNDDRAEWAGAALRHFQRITGTEDEDSLGDLLCDLMHWSDRNNYDFECALFRAVGHYKAETGGDVSRRPWPRTRKGVNAEVVEALGLCVDVLGELARLDDGTPSISALHLAQDALAKLGTKRLR